MAGTPWSRLIDLGSVYAIQRASGKQVPCVIVKGRENSVFVALADGTIELVEVKDLIYDPVRVLSWQRVRVATQTTATRCLRLLHSFGR